MMRLDYVSKIDFPVQNIAENRSGIMDFTKLVVYGMLYRQFDTEMFETLMDSSLVTSWNRHNAKNPIDFKTNVNTAYLQRVLERNSEVLGGVKQDILTSLNRRIELGNLQEEDKRLHRLVAERLVDSLAPLSLFLLMAYRGSDAYKGMIPHIQGTIQRYLQKISVAEYVALMLMEILTSLKHSGRLRGDVPEKAPLQDDAHGRDGRRDGEPGNGTGRSPSGGTSTPTDAAANLLWKIRPHSREPGDRGRLQIVISDSGTRYREVKDTLNDRATAQVSRKSLNDFYMQDPDASDSNSLGLYYLSFLHDACRKVGIHMESFVHDVPEIGRTSVNLVLLF